MCQNDQTLNTAGEIMTRIQRPFEAPKYIVRENQKFWKVYQMLHIDLTSFEVVNNARNKKSTTEKVPGALERISQKQRCMYS